LAALDAPIVRFPVIVAHGCLDYRCDTADQPNGAIVQALEKFNWNQTHAAQCLDISRKTLIYRMEEFGLRIEHVETEDQAES
jgi:DNA-binding NtrC family response regulator